MYYEFLYVISSLDRLTVVLICADMVFETLMINMVGGSIYMYLYRYSDIMSYNNLIFNISALIYPILVFRYIGFWSHFGEIIMEKLASSKNIFDIWLSIDIVLTFELCNDIKIWKMEIFDEVHYIEIVPALGRCELHKPELELI